jgi:hypothetical protein
MTNIAKQMGLVDARGSRGVFSRGKPVYREGSNSPKAGPGMESFPIGNRDPKKKTVPPKNPQQILQRAAKKRLMNRGNAR